MSQQRAIKAITPRQVSAMKKQEMAPKASADPQALLSTLSGSAPKARWAVGLPPGAVWGCFAQKRDFCVLVCGSEGHRRVVCLSVVLTALI